MLQRLEPWMKGIWRGQDGRPQSLKEMQRNNLEGRPQIHFRNQGFPPAKRLVCIRSQEAGGRRPAFQDRGWGGCSFHRMYLSMCPALIHTANGQVPTRRGNRGFVKTTRKKLAHKSNPVTVTFEGDPIFF